MIIPTVSPTSNVIYDYDTKPEYPVEDYEDNRISNEDVAEISSPLSPQAYRNWAAIAIASGILILIAIILTTFIRKYFKKTNPRSGYHPVAQDGSLDSESPSYVSITIEPPLPPLTPSATVTLPPSDLLALERKSPSTSASKSGASSDEYLPSTLSTIPSHSPSRPPFQQPIGILNEADYSPLPSKAHSHLPLALDQDFDQLFIESGWPRRPAIAKSLSLPVLRWDTWQSSQESSADAESIAADDSMSPTDAEGSETDDDHNMDLPIPGAFIPAHSNSPSFQPPTAIRNEADVSSQSSLEDFHTPPSESPSFFTLPARITPPGSRHQLDPFWEFHRNMVIRYDDTPDEVAEET